MSVWRRVLVPWLWVGLLVPWTWALLTPIPGGAVERVGGQDMSLLISKSLHGGVYAFLAILTLALPLSMTRRILLLGMLIAHGGSTEYLQQFVQRHASWWDFALDTAGVLLGAGLAWLGRRCLRRDPRRVSPQVEFQADGAGEHGDADDLR